MIDPILPQAIEDDLIIGEIEPEFGKPCDANCNQPAEWAAYITHARDICPGFFYLCEPHRVDTEQWWITQLKNGAMCSKCMTRPTGQLSDNLRLIKL
jgi:hypothetical protein